MDAVQDMVGGVEWKYFWLFFTGVVVSYRYSGTDSRNERKAGGNTKKRRHVEVSAARSTSAPVTSPSGHVAGWME